MSAMEAVVATACVAVLVYAVAFAPKGPPSAPQVQAERPSGDLDYCAPGILGSPCWTNQKGMPGMPGTKWK